MASTTDSGTTCPDMTEWILRWSHGDQEAGERVAKNLQPEIRKLANSLLKGSSLLRPGATDLTNEAWLKFLSWCKTPKVWTSRKAFLAGFHVVMRHALLDMIQKAKKHSASIPLLEVEIGDERYAPRPDQWEAIDHQLNELRTERPRIAKVLEMVFFGGYSTKQIAEALEVCERTIRNDRAFGLRWLRRRLNDLGGEESSSQA